ncbi:MAG: AAA family ATPase [Nitrososphaerales archaeon]
MVEKLRRMYYGALSEYEGNLEKLRNNLREEKQYRKDMEAWAESLKKDFDKLKDWVNELKEPPTYGGILIEPREKDAIVLSQKGLETVFYGKLTEEQSKKIKPGKRVFIGNVPIAARDPRSGDPINDPATGQQMVKVVPGITEIWEGEEAPLIRGRILTINPAKSSDIQDEDLVVIGLDASRTVSKWVPKTVIKSMKIKPNSVVDCLPETFKIIRVNSEPEASKYEVVERPTTSFDYVGGLKEAKMELIRCIINPIMNPGDYSKFKRAPRKILFYGPPGCGKTMLARALASSLSNCGFYRINAGEIYHWLLGSSAENLRIIFNNAVRKLEDGEFENMIIFLDEIDALAPHRGVHPGSSGAEERVVGQLLSILDGFDSLPNTLSVIGATNLPILLDSAVRQRFDRIIKIAAPSDRTSVFEIVSKYITSTEVPIDKQLILETGTPEKAAKALSEQFTEFLLQDEEIQTRYGRAIRKKDILTGRLVAQVVEHAKDTALDDRTAYKIGSGTISKDGLAHFGDVLHASGLNSKYSILRKNYSNEEDIGINLQHLKDGFEKVKIERAEEMMALSYRYQLDEPNVPDLPSYK